MANKDRNKRAARQARQEERARVEAAQAASASGKAEDGKSKAVVKSDAQKKPEKKADPNKKPGFFARVKNYLGDVKSEMHRVVWPSKDELKSYSVAIIIMLIVFGVVIWLVDSGVVALLVGYTGLRG